MLAQKAGSSSEKAVPGTFYYTMTPNFAGDNLCNYQSSIFNKKTSLLDGLIKVKGKMDIETGCAYSPTVWPYAASIQYKSADGTWKKVGEDGRVADGTKDNRQYLSEKLNNAPLVYGQNYRVASLSDNYWIYVFTSNSGPNNDPINNSTVTGGPYYVKVTSDIQYPIYGKDNKNIVFYASIQQAISANETNIFVGVPNNIPKASTVIIPAGTTLTIDAPLTVDGTLTNNGTIIVNKGGSIIGTVSNAGTIKSDSPVTVTGTSPAPLTPPMFNPQDGTTLEKDPQTGIQAQAPDYLKDAKLDVKTCDPTDPTVAALLTKLVETSPDGTKKTVLKVFDLNLLDEDGNVVKSVDGKIRVFIPCVTEPGKVYTIVRHNDDGTTTDIVCTVVDGGLVFETDHFSVYALVTSETVPVSKPTVSPPTGDTAAPMALLLILSATCAVGSIAVISKKHQN